MMLLGLYVALCIRRCRFGISDARWWLLAPRFAELHVATTGGPEVGRENERACNVYIQVANELIYGQGYDPVKKNKIHQHHRIYRPGRRILV